MTVTLSREKHTVTNARRPVRPKGDSTTRNQPMPVVAVTGAAGGIGHALTARLVLSRHVKKVIAIDDQRGDIEGVTWRVADVRDPALAGKLTGADVVVHADLDLSPDTDVRQRRAFNVRGAQTVLTAAAAARVGRVVLVTSSMVYGARPDNPVPLPEDAPLAADADSSVAGDMLEIEQLARRSPRAYPGMAVTVVRPAALVGDGRSAEGDPWSVDTLVTRHFEAPRLLAVKGSAPRWQFCHVEDLVSALELTVGGGIGGALAVGCDGWLEQAEVERISGLKSIELPARLTFGAAQRLHRMGVTPAPAIDLRYVVYPWVVDCAALRGAGWRPRFDNEAALRVLLDQRHGRHAVAGRRIARKEATITAAGATVAVIGTAAIVRRARRRHRAEP
jgi:nucleoside-diphosphate-sugar epimerase